MPLLAHLLSKTVRPSGDLKAIGRPLARHTKRPTTTRGANRTISDTKIVGNSRPARLELPAMADARRGVMDSRRSAMNRLTRDEARTRRCQNREAADAAAVEQPQPSAFAFRSVTQIRDASGHRFWQRPFATLSTSLNDASGRRLLNSALRSGEKLRQFSRRYQHGLSARESASRPPDFVELR